MLTHWIVETDVCSWMARVCRATLTIVVSKMTASAPTTRIKALLSTFGSIRSWPGSRVVLAAMSPSLRLRDGFIS